MKTIEEILVILENNSAFADMVWIGKDYSKGDLIKDLKELLKETHEQKRRS